MHKEQFYAITTLIGVTVGAGILGIPYVFVRSGILIGLLELIVIACVVCFLTLFLGEITLRTRGNHQLPELAARYLGNGGKYLMTLSSVLFINGALTIYTIASGQAIAAMIPLHTTIASLLFLSICSLFIFFGIRLFEKSELYLTGGIVLIILLLAILSLPFLSSHESVPLVSKDYFTPYGVLVFALFGIWSVPQMKEELSDKKGLFFAIIWGVFLSALIYVLFTLIVVGVTGASTSEVATIALGQTIGRWMILLGNTFSLFAMGTSFIALGFALKETYTQDYGMQNTRAWLFVILVPLIIFLFTSLSFVELMSMTASVTSVIVVGLILVMYHRAKKQGDRFPEYSLFDSKLFSIAIFLAFLLGLIMQFV